MQRQNPAEERPRKKTAKWDVGSMKDPRTFEAAGFRRVYKKPKEKKWKKEKEKEEKNEAQQKE